MTSTTNIERISTVVLYVLGILTVLAFPVLALAFGIFVLSQRVQERAPSTSVLLFLLSFVLGVAGLLGSLYFWVDLVGV